MSFQQLINAATDITIKSGGIVANTVTRDGTVRTVSRGGQPWEFTVTLPDGPRWTEFRPLVAAAQRYERHTPQNILFNIPGHSYLFGYQGNMTPPNSNGTFNGSWGLGQETFSLTGGSGSPYRVVPGDFVQLGSTGHVYQVVEYTGSSSTTVRVHRPIIDATGSGNVYIGSACTFNVIATQFPQPRIFAYNQVAWTGPFVFTEVID